RAWIDAGAEWPAAAAKARPAEHWAFRAPRRPSVPSGAEHPIDAFLAVRLKAEGLTFAPEADRITLLRRLHFDLIGLPPSPADVDAFLADGSAEAYPRAVERLLASPHYGERWGRHWLDAARYSDSDGFEKDKPRFVWFYRDWVVGSLNRDLPYDQFVLEQIAGDLLEGATQDQHIATGYLRNAMLNEEGGVDPEQFRMEAMFDRMDAIGKGILGLTVQCGQCHSHKFDPLTQEEYYRMFAFLNNDHESSRVVYTPDQLQRISALRREMAAIEEDVKHRTPDWEERLGAWERRVTSEPAEWQVVPSENAGDNGERFYYHADGSIRAASYAPTQWTARFRGTNRLGTLGAFRLEQLTDPNLPCHGPGRSIRGMSALSEFKVTAIDLAQPTNRVEIKFVRATADFENPEKDLEPEFDNRSGKKRTYGPVAHAIDGNPDTAWGIDAGPGRRNQPRQAVFVADRVHQFPQGAILEFGLVQNHGGWNSDDNQNHNLGRFRLSVSASTNAVADTVPAAAREVLRVPAGERSAAQKAVLFSAWWPGEAGFAEARAKVESLWAQWPEGSPTLTLAARRGAGPGDEPRPTQMLRRGDWLKPGNEVTPATPAFLHPMPPGATPDRLGFAKWLVDRNSPTTARALVNRVWQQYFGIGLVETSEDLGTQAAPASHPELLDWLAVEFMEPMVRPAGESSVAAPWSMKHLHRLIVNSRAYRQSSRVTPEALAKDPYNRWLARGSRQRVEGEVVRDMVLATSGLLNAKVGGPPVFPPAPGFLFQPPSSYGPKIWPEATGDERYRRALYTFRYRSVPYPVLQNFDTPNGDFACVRRPRSNTPMQALTSLNEVQFVEAAQALARRILESGAATDAARVEVGFRRVLSRPPTTSELRALLDLVERQGRRIAEGWVSAHELGTGKPALPKDLPKGATPAQLATYTAVSRVLLNLDEAITKE
ncbi:MAG: DUF1553 domain-containing protein, partial [Verrucomicrobiales bacterium]|nr:DUF1553 domain-containing protein [Verrucomicrobiales bacterium]